MCCHYRCLQLKEWLVAASVNSLRLLAIGYEDNKGAELWQSILLCSPPHGRSLGSIAVDQKVGTATLSQQCACVYEEGYVIYFGDVKIEFVFLVLHD